MVFFPSLELLGEAHSHAYEYLQKVGRISLYAPYHALLNAKTLEKTLEGVMQPKGGRSPLLFVSSDMQIETNMMWMITCSRWDSPHVNLAPPPRSSSFGTTRVCAQHDDLQARPPQRIR